MTKNMKIKRFLRSGEIGTEPKTVSDLLDSAGGLLDRACSHDILGEVVFEGADGQVYVATVECVIGKINPKYLKELQDEDAESLDESPKVKGEPYAADN